MIDENDKRYKDIILLPHYEPKNHPRMPMKDRVYGFSDFLLIDPNKSKKKEEDKDKE